VENLNGLAVQPKVKEAPKVTQAIADSIHFTQERSTMFDVTNFLTRWLFLCNLVRDVAEIQTLPYNPQHVQIQQQIQIQHPVVSCEEEWKDNCLRGILSYPPGSQRLLVMDAMRAELIQKLSTSIHQADETIERYERARQNVNEHQHPTMEVDDGDPYLDADLEILKTFERETLIDDGTSNMVEDSGADEQLSSEKDHAVLVIATNAPGQADPMIRPTITHSEPFLVEEGEKPPLPSPEQVEDAQRTVRSVRDYLPQLVSVVLKSPPAFEPNLLNPIDKLRKVITNRCVEDANWGVDMCWLLEAEVGRAWKTLFEHRQQTGRRLIVVLAKIGTEKMEAFDLLQDAEQATAYGYTSNSLMDDYHFHHQQQHYNNGYPQPRDDSEHAPARLPSSLSLRRCSHFGDTMHFIDRLTRTSIDLRQVPTIHRHVSFIDFLLPLK
jgi:hypothetical protein